MFRLRTLLIVLSAASGAAALVYEIVWLQLLQLVMGSSTSSLALLLALFMGGMYVGSVGLPRLVSAGRPPLPVYALLEIGIAIVGILVLFVLPYGGSYGTSAVGRVIYCIICIVPSTLLMGATLPAIARCTVGAVSDRANLSSLGFLYAANIIGAVAGSLLAGFYLLRLYDVGIATFTAASINISVAVIALLLARIQRQVHPEDVRSSPPLEAESGANWQVYVAIGLSGSAALGAEVIWTRLLSLILGASVYSFSLIVAVFMIGLGIGSSAGSALSRRLRNARTALGVCQVLAAASIAWAAYILTQVLPFWPVDVSLTRQPWLNFQLDVLSSAWAVLPAACFWGASFPLALAALHPRHRDPGRIISGIYAANTLGAITGAIFFTIVFVPAFGTQRAQQILAAIAGIGALVVFVSIARLAMTAAAIAVVAIAIWSTPATPAALIAYGRFTARTLGQHDAATGQPFSPKILYAGEGANDSVAVSENPQGYLNFHVSGKIEASTEPQDMRLQRMLAYLPAAISSGPRSVLVVGLGAGVTAGSFVNYPGIERIVICEIEPIIPHAVSKYFGEQNNHVLEDPRVQLIYDDARHYLLTTDNKFDLITSDPIHPWVKGAAALYTREYIDLVRHHLNPGGVVSQWVPLYQSSLDAVKSELSTFFQVFNDATLWSNNVGGTGFDIVLIGRNTGTTIDVDSIEQRLKSSEYARTLHALEEVGFKSPEDLLATYMGRAGDLASWLDGAEINRDRNLRLQYLAGLAMTADEGPRIYRSLLEYRRFPHQMFAGTPERIEDFRSSFDHHRPRALTPAQASAISKSLASGPARHLSISAVRGDLEAFQYAAEIGQAIAAGGWQVERVTESRSTDLVVGMLISVATSPPPAAANELFRALRSAGLAAPGYIDPAAPADSVLLLVGQKQE
jgi:spermidine synthase